MPKNKKQDTSASESDSGPEDRNPPAKKSKQASQKPTKKDDEEDSWSIGKNRFIKLREFKGRFFVDIREFYDADGEMKPGKKGISLSLEQWNSVKNCVEEVEDAIKRRC